MEAQEFKVNDRRPQFNDEPETAIQVSDQSPAAMMEMAMSKGMDLDKLEKFMELQERYQANEAKKAFYQSVAAFKAIAPPVSKDKYNKFFDSWYTSLGNLLDTYNPPLGTQGLSISFPLNGQSLTDTSMTATCRLSHAMGHYEDFTMTVPIDKAAKGNQSGKKSRNDIQDVKSTFTYLRSMTAEAVLGVAGTEATLDDDGNGAGSKIQFITKKQAIEITDLLRESGADEEKFLTYFDIEKIQEMTAKRYREATKFLTSKIENKKAKEREKELENENN